MKPVASAPVIEFGFPAGHWTIMVRQRSYIELVKMTWRAKLRDQIGK
jgi:hypothetical protein